MIFSFGVRSCWKLLHVLPTDLLHHVWLHMSENSSRFSCTMLSRMLRFSTPGNQERRKVNKPVAAQLPESPWTVHPEGLNHVIEVVGHLIRAIGRREMKVRKRPANNSSWHLGCHSPRVPVSAIRSFGAAWGDSSKRDPGPLKL